MAEESTVDLLVRTRADESGVVKVDNALNKAEKAARELGTAGDAAGDKLAKSMTQAKAAIDRAGDALDNAKLPAQNGALAASQDKAAKSSVNLAQAMLQASRGVQDFQAAGLMGAVNNFESIAMAAGLGAGAAGAVTLLAVAAQVAGPHIAAFFKSLDKDGAALDAFKKTLQDSAAAILGDWTPATQAAKDASEGFAQELSAEKDALDALEGSLKTGLDLFKERARIQGDLAKNEEAEKIDAIKAQNLPKDEEARQIGAVKIERINADKDRAQEVLAAEDETSGLTLGNATDAAARAAMRRQNLADEKQRALLAATLDQEIGEQLDKDGNVIAPAVKGAAERVLAAEKQVDMAKRGEGDNREAVAEAEARLAQENQRLADLENERQQNLKANGGGNFRDIKTIDAELDKARGAESATATEAEAAREARAELTQRQAMQRELIDSNYKRDRGAVLKTLPPDADAPRRVNHDKSVSDPFEKQTQARAVKPQRNLAEEEAWGNGDSDAVASSIQAAAQARKEADEMAIKLFAEMKKDAEKMQNRLRGLQTS